MVSKLNTNGRLTDAEFEEIQRHVEIECDRNPDGSIDVWKAFSIKGTIEHAEKLRYHFGYLRRLSKAVG